MLSPNDVEVDPDRPVGGHPRLRVYHSRHAARPPGVQAGLPSRRGRSRDASANRLEREWRSTATHQRATISSPTTAPTNSSVTVERYRRRFTRESSIQAASSFGSKRSKWPHLTNGIRRSATSRRTCLTLTPRWSATSSMSSSRARGSALPRGLPFTWTTGTRELAMPQNLPGWDLRMGQASGRLSIRAFSAVTCGPTETARPCPAHQGPTTSGPPTTAGRAGTIRADAARPTRDDSCAGHDHRWIRSEPA